MLVNSQTLAAVRTGFRAIFKDALGKYQEDMATWKKIATVFDSTTEKETYNWLGAVPSMSEWKDQRQLHGLRNFDYTLTNKDWEATVEVERNAIRDDKLGMVTPRIRSLARAYLRFIFEKVFSQLDDGATLLAYDGTAMFADTRTIGASANIDNLLSGAYSGSSAEIRAAISAAMVAMAAYQDDWGKPMNLVPDTIVCSPSMYVAIREALKADVAGQQRTESEFIKNIISSPWIDSDVLDWYLLCTTEEVKPIIFQNRQNAEFNQVDNPNDSHVFLHKTFLYGVDCRFQVGYGDPRTAIKIVDA